MAADPFAAAEQELNKEAEASNTETTTSTKKETSSMTTENSQDKVVVTLKGGSGYDAPWIVIHADTVEQATDILNDEAAKELIDQTKKVAGYFSAGSGKQSSGGKQYKGKPAGAAQAPNGQTPPEGYVFKSGISQKGKPWKAFMPIEKNSGLEVIWL